MLQLLLPGDAITHYFKQLRSKDRPSFMCIKHNPQFENYVKAMFIRIEHASVNIDSASAF